VTGAEMKESRKRLELQRPDFALLLGYIGNDRNNENRIKKYEDSELVPLYIGKLVWLIETYVHEHNGNLPHWPENLRIEGEDQPWK
jgi:hypothetical protein